MAVAKRVSEKETLDEVGKQVSVDQVRTSFTF